MYFSDSNINVPDEDRLNRSKFAKTLANSVAAYTGDDCLTISLMGKWGSGKTSIIKMFEFYLRQFDRNQLIVYFNPWNFSTRNNLLFQFFNVLSKIDDKRFTRIVNKENLKNFAIFLVNSVSFSFPFEGAGVTFNPKIENVSSDDETLNDLKEKIAKDFRRLNNNKVIIVIDDIDRLTNVEIQQIFMLVKSLADFPNVRYLLSFDKKAVLGSLDKLNVYSPDTFIEKIIQIPINVPEISQFQLNDLIDEHLFDFYNVNYPRSKINISENDIVNIKEFIRHEFFNVRSLLIPFFKTPRDLYRYVNILKFYYSTFKHQVNINDFMLIVAIQLFQEDVYNYIKSNKMLFLVNYDENKKRELKDINKQEIDCVVNLTNNPNHIKKVLLGLFPQLNYYYRNMDYAISYLRKWGYDLRICADKFFDGYFTLTIDDNKISMLEIKDLFKFKDTESISNFILRQNEENKTKYLFDLMINRIEDISKENAEYFIASLIDIGDLLEIPYNMFSDKRTYLSRILDDLLKKYDSNEERYKVLEKAIENLNDSLYVIIELLSHEDFVYNKFNYVNDRLDVSEALLDENHLVKLETLLCKKINHFDRNGKLWHNLDLEHILYSWENWETGIDVVERVKEFINIEKNLLIFAKGFRNINSTIMHADSPSEFVHKFNIKSMLKYFDDIDDLRDRCVELNKKESLSVAEKEICESLIKQIDMDK